MKKNLFSVFCILLLASSQVFAQPLCLSWNNVSANRSNCNAIIAWSYEQCSPGTFYVQYSTNASSYTTIGSRSSTGSGNQNYTFTDNYACPGVAGVNNVYYRILFVDIDGNLKNISSVLQVSMAGCNCSNNNTNRCPSGVSSPSITISGADAICLNSSQNYTVAGASGNYIITWNLTSPSGSTASLTTNGNIATLTQGNTNAGNLTLTATFIPLNQCVAPVSIPAFTVRVGAPPYTAYSTLTTGGNTSEISYCNTLVSFDGFYYGDVDVYDPQATSFSWTRTSTGPVVSSMSPNPNQPGPGHWIVNLRPTSNTVTWILTRSNACGSVVNYFNFATPGNSCNGGVVDRKVPKTASMVVVPNPAVSTVLIQLKEPAEAVSLSSSKVKQPAKGIQQIKVTNRTGVIKKLIKGNNQSQMNINISDLSPDIYSISLFDGTDWISDKIIKQ